MLESQQTMDPTIPAEMLMYLNAKGIALVNPATRVRWATAKQLGNSLRR